MKNYKKIVTGMALMMVMTLVLVSCGNAVGEVVKPAADNIAGAESPKPKNVLVQPQFPENPNANIMFVEANLKEIWLAGGCFWGLEAYMDRVPGVADVVSGYANGNTENPSYEDVVYKSTGHVETVRVKYDPNMISLDELLN